MVAGAPEEIRTPDPQIRSLKWAFQGGSNNYCPVAYLPFFPCISAAETSRLFSFLNQLGGQPSGHFLLFEMRRHCEADGAQPSRGSRPRTLAASRSYTGTTSRRGSGCCARGVTSTKTFILQRAVDGKTRRITIAPVLGVSRRARGGQVQGPREVVQLLLQGDRPQGRPGRRARSAQALEVYLSSRTLRPRTAASYRDAVERQLRDWLDLPLGGDHPDHGPRAPRRLDQGIGKAAADGAMRVLQGRLQQRRLPLHRRRPAAEPGQA